MLYLIIHSTYVNGQNALHTRQTTTHNKEGNPLYLQHDIPISVIGEIVHITDLVTPVVEHWLKLRVAHWRTPSEPFKSLDGRFLSSTLLVPSYQQLNINNVRNCGFKITVLKQALCHWVVFWLCYIYFENKWKVIVANPSAPPNFWHVHESWKQLITACGHTNINNVWVAGLK